jgi:hypothetical protein
MMDSFPIWGAPAEMYFYALIYGLWHLGAILAVAIFSLPLVAFRRSMYFPVVGKAALFIAILFLSGAFMNALWSSFVWGNLYFSTDYVVDFSPFRPIAAWVIESGFGQYKSGWINNGWTLAQLNHVWLLYALTTWCLATATYLGLERRWAGLRILEKQHQPHRGRDAEPAGA